MPNNFKDLEGLSIEKDIKMKQKTFQGIVTT